MMFGCQSQAQVVEDVVDVVRVVWDVNERKKKS